MNYTIDDMMEFAQKYDRLGWAIQSQLVDIMEGEYNGINSNAVDFIENLLGHYKEVADAVDGYRAHATQKEKR